MYIYICIYIHMCICKIQKNKSQGNNNIIIWLGVPKNTLSQTVYVSETFDSRSSISSSDTLNCLGVIIFRNRNRGAPQDSRLQDPSLLGLDLKDSGLQCQYSGYWFCSNNVYCISFRVVFYLFLPGLCEVSCSKKRKTHFLNLKSFWGLY